MRKCAQIVKFVILHIWQEMATVCLWLKGMTSRAEELGKHQPSPGQRSPTDTQRSHSSHNIDNFFLVFATTYSHARTYPSLLER